MVDFVVFNELSLPLSDNNWRREIKDYIDITNSLRSKGISNIRIEDHFKNLPLFTETKTLAQFFGTLPPDMKTRLRSLLFNQVNTYQSPLIIPEVENEQLETLMVNSEYHFEDVVNRGGLACAHIWNTLAINFTTHNKWLENQVVLKKVYIEGAEEDVTVSLISNVEQIVSHNTFILELISQPKNTTEFFSFCDQKNDRYQYTVIFNKQGLNDLERLFAEDQDYLNRMYILIQSMKGSPFEGRGKPEGLKFNLAGYTSRRITQKHRVVYHLLANEVIEISMCYGHYE
ncbi:Txe/YoeB family addiction module toxin [Photobacterium piscicola]|uniref:Putative mRNA interferase YoeB n=1 Tax=Photobacterium piscicola TaxID=1378299 RepID=A0ABU6LG70_9GAMM|nr:Txe/YoeB family addiction module toxin [Photobacterium piscicola]